MRSGSVVPEGRGRAILQAFMLGPFRLVINDVEITKEDWKSRKALTLLQYLLAHRGMKVHRDALLELLWPEEDPQTSKSKLHPTLYMLRRTLEPGLQPYQPSSYVHHGHSMYWFENGPSCWVDIEEFESLCRSSAACTADDPAQALALSERAVSLYRGDFLAEEAVEDWAIIQRERLRELFIEAALRASYLTMKLRGDVTAAVRFCREALTYDPCREEVYQAMISHLIDARRYAEATTCYRECSAMLQEEFGLPPSPETRTLYDKMRRIVDGTATGEGSEVSALNLERNGPLQCDRYTFDALHALLLRQQQRTGQHVTVLEIRPQGSALSEAERGVLMDALSRILRQGDAVCWDHERALLLLVTDGRGADVVRRRLRRTLQEAPLPPLSITTRVYEPPEDGKGTESRLHPTFAPSTRGVSRLLE